MFALQKANLQVWRGLMLDSSGALQQDVILACSRAEARASLISQGFIPIRIKRDISPGRKCWHLRQKIEVLRQLSTLLQAGIALDDGCRLIAQQHPLPGWRALLNQIAGHISTGKAFSDTLALWPTLFPPLFIALLRTGELTGKLELCCHRLAEQQERQYQLQIKIRKALRYPLFTLGVTLLVSAAMLGFVLPEFASIYQSFNTPLPSLTRAFIALSHALIQYSVPVVAAIALCFPFFTHLRKQMAWQMREQRWLLSLPFTGALLRGQKLSQIHTTLALTQQAGISLLQGLETAGLAMTHPWWRAALTRVQKKLLSGDPLSQAIAQETAFSPLCVQLIRTGEESGTLDNMLARLGQWHTEQTQDRADTLAAAPEPAMMSLMGGIVGTLTIALYLPVFRLGEAISMG